MTAPRLPGQALVDSIRRRPRRLAASFAVLTIAVATAIALGPAESTGPPSAEAAQTRPNIIVLLTDDQESASMRVMKTVAKEMKRKGVTMKRYYDNFPLCCPSRTTLLTGQYAHNHGVLSNQEPDGGYGVFNELHGNSNLAIWLQDSGYTTGYIGKFLNEYAEPDEYGTLPTDVPKGWDDWRVLAPSNAQYFDYTLNQNGKLRDFGSSKDDYSTDVFTNKAKRFIRRNSPGDDPFFLELGYAAPHGGGGGSPGRSCNRGAVPAPRHLGTLKKKKKGALPPSFNEADVSDKPSPVAELGLLTEGQISDTLRKRRCAWESLLAVDESVGTLLDEVKRDGERRNTYVFFLSDNGYMRGEHRIRNNKRFLYEPSARIPFIARGPGIARGESSDDVVVSADVVPTILELTGVQPRLVQDGTSLMPTLASPATEHGREILLEAYAGDQITGVRNSRYVYTEWDTGRAQPEKELYDTYADPHQLTNLAGNSGYAGLVANLGDRLDQLIDCAGADCHAQPSGQVSFATAGTGNGGCTLGPVGARFTSPQSAEISTVEFRIDGRSVVVDNSSPYDAALPDSLLLDALPKAAQVLALANFDDGRRLAVPATIKLCR